MESFEEDLHADGVSYTAVAKCLYPEVCFEGRSMFATPIFSSLAGTVENLVT